MNAAVTGVSGFFGGALARVLRARGDRVRALFRRPDQAVEFARIGVEPVLGDLTDPGACEGLVKPGDVVVHAAARVDMCGRWEKFRRTTIEGTRNLLTTALSAGPRRFVYISSGGVYAMDGKSDVFRAERVRARPSSYNFYGRAKLEAEKLVRRECARAGCEWTILRMGFLYGTGNRALFKHVVPLARDNRLFIIGSGSNRIATLYIDDAVKATILAGEAPAAARKIYDVASDEAVTQRQFYEETAAALDLPKPTRHVNRNVAFVLAWLVDWLAQSVGHDFHVSRAAVDLMSADQAVDSTPIRTDLGWRPEISFAEGMRRVRAWSRGLGSSSGKENPSAPHHGAA